MSDVRRTVLVFLGTKGLLAFATWFMVSAIVVKLTGTGFDLSRSQLFWLASMPGLVVCAPAAGAYTAPTHVSQFAGFLWRMLGLFLFSGIGNASTFKQMPMMLEPRQAGGAIGWTSAVAAYGPFLVNALLGAVIAATGSPRVFYTGGKGVQ